MTNNTDKDTCDDGESIERHGEDDIECPEYNCSIAFSSVDEVEAHLEWDHNRTSAEIERKLQQLRDDE